VLDIANIAERKITTSLNLPKGSITANVLTKLTPGSSYKVKTPEGVADVVGTIYQLTAAGKLIVASGTVNFTYNEAGVSKTVAVTAGQQVTVNRTTGVATIGPALPTDVGQINNIARIIASGRLIVGALGIVTTTGTATVDNPNVNSVSAPKQ
jgi:hypothetical protein